MKNNTKKKIKRANTGEFAELKSSNLPVLKLAISFVVLAICCLLPAAKVFAQNQFHLTISPPIIEAVIKPGKTITQVYNIENKGNKTQMYADIIPFYPKGEKGNVQIDHLFLNPFTYPNLEESQYRYLRWFSLQNANLELREPFTLQKDEKKQLVLKIRIPTDAKQKEYLSSLIVRSYPSLKLEEEQISSSGIIASNILMSISDTASWTKKGESDLQLANSICIPKTNICLPILDSFQIPEFKIRIKNQSKYHFKTKGNLIIKNIFGNEIDRKKLLPLNVLPNSTREINCIQEGKKIPCKSRSLNFGIYKAELETDLSSMENAQIHFVVLPFIVIAAALIALIFYNRIKKVLFQSKKYGPTLQKVST
jgi:hypothetical protein